MESSQQQEQRRLPSLHEDDQEDRSTTTYNTPLKKAGGNEKQQVDDPYSSTATSKEPLASTTAASKNATATATGSGVSPSRKSAAASSSNTIANHPPTVITVDPDAKSTTSAADGPGGGLLGGDSGVSGVAAHQEKTPKHANKQKDHDDPKTLTRSASTNSADASASAEKDEASKQHYQHQHAYRGQHGPSWQHGPPPPHYPGPPPPSGNYPYDTRSMGGAGAAFTNPRESRHHGPPSHPPMHVSPGGSSTGGGAAAAAAAAAASGSSAAGRYYPPHYAGSSGAGGRYPPYDQRFGGPGEFRYPEGSGNYPMQRHFGGHPYQPPPPHAHHPGHHHPGHGPPPPHPHAHHPGHGPPHPGHGPPPPHHAYGYEGHPPGARAGWGMPPSGYGGGRPPLNPSHMNPEYYGGPPSRGGSSAPGERPGSAHGNTNFSRAVSGSFDRSIKSREDKTTGSAASQMEGIETSRDGGHHGGSEATRRGRGGGDNHSFADDASWKMLNQVHSVDEDEMRRRKMLKQRSDTPETRKEVAVGSQPPGSNSSSLTNSPTEGVEQQANKKPPPPDGSKRTSSLDSLSSVASAQEPMETSHKPSHGNSKPTSPGGSSGSLDLMKCASGSSALLLPSHQRTLSQFSFAEEGNSHQKRPHDDEEREDVGNMKDNETELRKAPSADDSRPTKKRHIDHQQGGAGSCSKSHQDATKKSSPLSITCSPPNSPHPTTSDKRKSVDSNDTKMHQPQAVYPGRKAASSPAFYDKGPSYTYSMDSVGAPPAREHASSASVGRADHYPPNQLPRPGSSSSSTITPMNVDGHEMRHVPVPPGVATLPSWEIHPQDSFGATSQNGNPLMPSFSFPHDYPMLAHSASGEMQPALPPPPPERGSASVGHLESRNQSFEGGHYHGSFGGASESMMSYESRGSFDGRQPPYQGPFPPHAPSWGSASSYPPPPHSGYAQYPSRGSYPMMRNYSEDSSARTSPPPGGGGGPPGSLRMLPPNFQPPPEFRAPPSMVSKSGPQNTILTSPYNPSPKVGPYGWSKEEDSQLTEIMKKYKNPRDWEPIAKEHGHGRTAKECHERWIRYLKPGVRKGQWTDHEDAIVMEVVTTSSEQPFTRWSDLAQRLPGRVGKQIRDRWVNHLNPAINHLPFSREDDLLLWEGHKKLGKRWVEISTKYFHSSRSENHIKNRWYSASFKKFIANEFGPDAYSGGKASQSSGSGGGKKESPDKKKKPGGSSSSPRRRSGGGVDDIHVESV